MKKGGGKSKFRFKEPKEFEEEVLQIDRVTRVVKGGRRLRFRVTVVIGDRKGRVGIGIGKSNEVVGGIKKAVTEAKKNVAKICIYNDTIPHEVNYKFKAAKVLLLPAGPGTGLIAGGAVRRVLELAGVKNILSKRLGSTNKINNAKATFLALQDMTWKESTIKKEEEEKQVTGKEDKKAGKPKSTPKKEKGESSTKPKEVKPKDKKGTAPKKKKEDKKESSKKESPKKKEGSKEKADKK